MPVTTTIDPFTAMQAAVDIVNTSPHPANKVAATVFGEGFAVAKTNYWPAPILSHFGMDQDIGSSSGTVHAEVACLLAAPMTEGASLCITDPFCPNCAKNIAEAGIKTVYIDHKGFDKDFAARRGDHFKNMSMQICSRAGISVYEVHRKEKTRAPILEIAPGYTPPNDAPVIVSNLDDNHEATFLDMVADARANLSGHKFAIAMCKDEKGKPVGICARSHLAIGYSRHIKAEELNEDSGKYSFVLEPVNRILMNTSRLGLTIDPRYFYSHTVPTSRELVNVVGANITTITIGHADQARDTDSLTAIKQLVDAKILSLQSV